MIGIGRMKRVFAGRLAVDARRRALRGVADLARRLVKQGAGRTAGPAAGQPVALDRIQRAKTLAMQDTAPDAQELAIVDLVEAANMLFRQHMEPARRERLILDLIEAAKGPLSRDTSGDPVHAAFSDFVQRVNALERPRVLEIGARARSGNTHRSHFAHAEYVGFDVHQGPNVDAVGDAHDLARAFPADHFDAVFSISVFEHLAMPWKAVLEIGAVLKPGGLLFVMTHPTWPPHDRPWDFWRYTSDAFHVLLNRTTGFEMVRCQEGLPCAVLPFGAEAPMVGLWQQPANLGVAALARKVAPADSRLRWDIGTADVIATHYPVE